MAFRLAALALGVVAALSCVAAASPTADVGWTVAYQGGHGIWVRSETGSAHQIRHGRGYDDLAWSPDGRWIAYSHSHPDGVYVTDAKGSQWWRVSRVVGRPHWSPDGHRLAIVSSHGVYVAAWDGSGQRRVLRGDCEVSWAAENVVAVCGGRLVEVSPEGRIRRLDNPRLDLQLAYVSGAPDGAYVAFGRRCTTTPIGSDTYCEIASIRPQDGVRRTLVPYRYGDWMGPTWAPVWVPGTHLVLVADYPRRTVRVDADTGASSIVRRGAAQILAAGSDGSFAVRQGLAVVVYTSAGRLVARIRVPFTDSSGLAVRPPAP